MIIVLDTNVVVSGILRPYSKSATILRFAASGLIRLAYDLRIISEYRDVLSRPKFGFSENQVEGFLAQLEGEGIAISAKPLPFHLQDPEDEPFLEVALSGEAICLVTGNKRHFPKKSYKELKIVSPAEFLEIWGGEL